MTSNGNSNTRVPCEGPDLIEAFLNRTGENLGVCILAVGALSICAAAFVCVGQVLLFLATLIEWLGGPPVHVQGNYALGGLMIFSVIAPFVLGDDDATAGTTAESQPHPQAQQNGRRRGDGSPSHQRRSTSSPQHPPEIVALPAARNGGTVTTEYRPIREVTGADITDAVQHGDLSGLMEAYPAQRLREYAAGAKPRPHTLGERIFGTKNDTLNRTRDVFNDLTELSNSATSALRAVNDFTAAKITAATAKQQFELEQAKLAAAIAEQAAKKAKHDAAARTDDFAEQVRRAAEQRVRETEAEAEQRVRTANAETTAARQAVKDAEDQRARDDYADLNARLTAALQRADELSKLAAEPRPAQDAEVDKAKRRLTLEELKTKTQQEQHQQCVDRERLKRRVAGVRDPETTRRRREEGTLRAAAEQFERDARDKMRQTKDKQQTLDTIRREMDQHLAQTAGEHGEASEAYDSLDAVYNNLWRELVDQLEC